MTTRAAAFSRRALLGALLLLATPAAAPAPAPLSAEDMALAQQAADYLNSLGSARARFVQVDPRGAPSSGEFWLQRPGKARFQYDPPSGVVIASDGRLVSIFNPRLKSFQSYPLGLTPLSILLARNIRLGHGVDVNSVRRTADEFTLTASQKRHAGSIALDFRLSPLALTGWTVTNAQGGETRVTLIDLRREWSFPRDLFDLRPPPPTAP